MLRIRGFVHEADVLTLRDTAFSIIGKRPREIVLDLTDIGLPLDRLVLEALVTISRVAGMVSVGFSVLVPKRLEERWNAVGLSRLMPLQIDPVYRGMSARPVELEGQTSLDSTF